MASTAAIDEQTRQALIERAEASYRAFAASGRALDLTRGKPSTAQLELSRGLLETVTVENAVASDGTDARNYGVLRGLPEACELMGALLGQPAEQIVLGNNSSLELMHDLVVQALLKGVPDGRGPWVDSGSSSDPVRFVCPVPGYDRHFSVLARYGIEMVPVPLLDDGPDLDQVRALVTESENTKGMFCVPRYSNPSGQVYSPEVVRALAEMEAAAPDFRIFWDDAYAVHSLGDETATLEDILALASEAGHAERPLIFGSTSKISLAGAGISAVAASPRNVEWILDARSIQTIGPDKLNELRHVRFFKDRSGLEAHMRRHADILRPKFEAVARILDDRLGETGLARWTRPAGGYFVSLDTLPGQAKRVVDLARDAGVKLTPAGATWPHGNDPTDSNLRLAPSLPPLEEVEAATELLCDCIVLASLRVG